MEIINNPIANEVYVKANKNRKILTIINKGTRGKTETAFPIKMQINTTNKKINFEERDEEWLMLICD